MPSALRHRRRGIHAPHVAGLFFAQAGERDIAMGASFPNDFVECVSVASVIVVAPVPGLGPANEYLQLSERGPFSILPSALRS